MTDPHEVCFHVTCQQKELRTEHFKKQCEYVIANLRNGYTVETYNVLTALKFACEFSLIHVINAIYELRPEVMTTEVLDNYLYTVVAHPNVDIFKRIVEIAPGVRNGTCIDKLFADACLTGNLEIIRQIYEWVPRVDINWAPVTNAILNNHFEVVRQLIEWYPEIINDAKYDYMFRDAFVNRDAQMARLLLEFKPTLNTLYREGAALTTAMDNNNFEGFQMLLDLNADKFEQNFCTKDEYGNFKVMKKKDKIDLSWIFIARNNECNNDIYVAELLRRWPSIIKHVEMRHLRKICKLAFCNRNYDLVKLIIESFAPETRDKELKLFFMNFCLRGDDEVIDKLLEWAPKNTSDHFMDVFEAKHPSGKQLNWHVRPFENTFLCKSRIKNKLNYVKTLRKMKQLRPSFDPKFLLNNAFVDSSYYEDDTTSLDSVYEYAVYELRIGIEECFYHSAFRLACENGNIKIARRILHYFPDTSIHTTRYENLSEIKNIWSVVTSDVVNNPLIDTLQLLSLIDNEIDVNSSCEEFDKCMKTMKVAPEFEYEISSFRRKYNDICTTPLFRACQNGHFEVVELLYTKETYIVGSFENLYMALVCCCRSLEKIGANYTYSSFTNSCKYDEGDVADMIDFMLDRHQCIIASKIEDCGEARFLEKYVEPLVMLCYKNKCYDAADVFIKRFPAFKLPIDDFTKMSQYFSKLDYDYRYYHAIKRLTSIDPEFINGYYFKESFLNGIEFGSLNKIIGMREINPQIFQICEPAKLREKIMAACVERHGSISIVKYLLDNGLFIGDFTEDEFKQFRHKVKTLLINYYDCYMNMLIKTNEWVTLVKDCEPFECEICYSDDCVKSITTPCNHIFCPNCINEWIKNNTTCPKCRAFIFNCEQNEDEENEEDEDYDTYSEDEDDGEDDVNILHEDDDNYYDKNEDDESCSDSYNSDDDDEDDNFYNDEREFDVSNLDKNRIMSNYDDNSSLSE